MSENENDDNFIEGLVSDTLSKAKQQEAEAVGAVSEIPEQPPVEGGQKDLPPPVLSGEEKKPKIKKTRGREKQEQAGGEKKDNGEIRAKHAEFKSAERKFERGSFRGPEDVKATYEQAVQVFNYLDKYYIDLIQNLQTQNDREQGRNQKTPGLLATIINTQKDLRERKARLDQLFQKNLENIESKKKVADREGDKRKDSRKDKKRPSQFENEFANIRRELFEKLDKERFKEYSGIDRDGYFLDREGKRTSRQLFVDEKRMQERLTEMKRVAGMRIKGLELKERMGLIFVEANKLMRERKHIPLELVKEFRETSQLLRDEPLYGIRESDLSRLGVKFEERVVQDARLRRKEDELLTQEKKETEKTEREKLKEEIRKEIEAEIIADYKAEGFDDSAIREEMNTKITQKQIEETVERILKDLGK